jgi:3-oxoacyl-[acyl-carrier-protein] synthase-3
MKNISGCRIIATGRAVPEKILTNADLEKLVDTSDSWIVERTGIHKRHIAEPGTPVSDLAAAAAREALAEADVAAEEIDLIIVGTVSGDMKLPATACFVQDKIGARNAVAFDINAACSGFLYSLQTASAMMQSIGYQRVLVIGAEILTSIVNWQDRDTCVLFGDGAGAVLLGPAEKGRGLLHSRLGSDGGYSGLLYNPGGGSLHPTNITTTPPEFATIHMEGREVFRHAVTAMTKVLQRVLEEAEITADEIDLLIPHQANLRIIEAVGKRFGIAKEKVYVNVDRFGNTSAASIPIAIDEGLKTGRIRAGDLVAMVTFGAGLTWAAAIHRF